MRVSPVDPRAVALDFVADAPNRWSQVIFTNDLSPFIPSTADRRLAATTPRTPSGWASPVSGVVPALCLLSAQLAGPVAGTVGNRLIVPHQCSRSGARSAGASAHDIARRFAPPHHLEQPIGVRVGSTPPTDRQAHRHRHLGIDRRRIDQPVDAIMRSSSMRRTDVPIFLAAGTVASPDATGSQLPPDAP